MAGFLNALPRPEVFCPIAISTLPAMMLVVATGIFALAAIVEATPKSPRASAKTIMSAANSAGRMIGATVLMVFGVRAP